MICFYTSTSFKGEHDVESYKEMYYELFNSTTKVIKFLQETHRKTEEMFISADDSRVTVSKNEESGNLSILKNND
ncbi:hypothetical protein SDC9_197904 [bioreactor metagenome]|uniref:Uncharacterized protein n=1 Tax=bioreactor metagenome TaxID=1076179 RepID=A0A645IG42_9ZZZZ